MLLEQFKNNRLDPPKWIGTTIERLCQEQLATQNILVDAMDNLQVKQALERKEEHNATQIVVQKGHTSIKEFLKQKAGHKELLDSLKFPEWKTRREEVQPAYANTFEWIFEELEGNQKWSSFADWLTTSNNIYWINGKAGSGKSTLMRFLLNHDKTFEMLNIWAAGQDLHVISYFFWRADGIPLQMNSLGLLRSLLYQLLYKRPDLSRVITDDIQSAKSGPDWDEASLSRAMTRTLRSIQEKTVIFIDGLDEFKGNLDRLLELCRELSTLENVKLCISSRPERKIEQVLASFETLQLQDLTQEAMRIFVRGMLERHRPNYSPDLYTAINKHELVYKLVVRAEGIFLWATIMTDSLLEAIDCGASASDLENIIQQSPQGLKSLFEFRLKQGYPEQANEIFDMLLLHTNKKLKIREPLILGEMAFAVDPHLVKLLRQSPVKVDQSTLHERLQAFRNRIKIQCCGLIDFGTGQVQDHSDCANGYTCESRKRSSLDRTTVKFAHRSVAEFLLEMRSSSSTSAESSNVPAHCALLLGKTAQCFLASIGSCEEHNCHAQITDLGGLARFGSILNRCEPAVSKDVWKKVMQLFKERCKPASYMEFSKTSDMRVSEASQFYGMLERATSNPISLFLQLFYAAGSDSLLTLIDWTAPKPEISRWLTSMILARSRLFLPILPCLQILKERPEARKLMSYELQGHTPQLVGTESLVRTLEQERIDTDPHLNSLEVLMLRDLALTYSRFPGYCMKMAPSTNRFPTWEHDPALWETFKILKKLNVPQLSYVIPFKLYCKSRWTQARLYIPMRLFESDMFETDEDIDLADHEKHSVVSIVDNNNTSIHELDSLTTSRTLKCVPYEFVDAVYDPVFQKVKEDIVQRRTRRYSRGLTYNTKKKNRYRKEDTYEDRTYYETMQHLLPILV